MPKTRQQLFNAARAAMENAHAPYSFYRVGAAVRGASGRVYAGTNVENASFPEGWCAETSAIAAMVTAGETRIEEVCVLSTGEPPATPCGGCRQRLAEFAGPDTEVHVGGPRGIVKSWRMDALLPAAFALQDQKDDGI